jgi:cell division inhibitor SepF
MAGAMRKMAVYLGLVEDPDPYAEYPVDEDGYPIEDEMDDDRDRERGRAPAREPVYEAAAPMATVSSLPERRVVQPRTDLSRITTLTPRTYNEARTLGESFRDGVPVIMNLGEMDDKDAKRLVDFSAGLVFGLHGTIERVTAKVFLLSPADIEVAAAEKVRVPERQFFNQS